MKNNHDSDVVKQSKSALKQWGPDWRQAAKHHAKHKHRDLLDFQNIGIGRAVLCIANGYSFEENLETIRNFQDKCDIMVVDKALKNCVEHGIKPKYVVVCDRHVSYEKYLKPIENELSDVTLFANVCANPKWTDNGNWKDIRFFVNKDCLNSEIELMELSGCQTAIAAGTNVSNALIVLLTQCDDQGARNFFGYDKILTIGFDYCWDEHYYAFDHDGDGKRNYMRGVYVYDLAGRFCYTSTNLLFSSKWLDRYIAAFKIPVIQCSRRSIQKGFKIGDLAEQIQYQYCPEDSQKVISLLEYRRKLSSQIEEINAKIVEIGQDHLKQLMRTT
jgi:hypothetical protein